jgi:hypothetical protein
MEAAPLPYRCSTNTTPLLLLLLLLLLLIHINAG